MRRWVAMAALVGLVASGGGAAPYERHLSVDRPADRAIMAYAELQKAGMATSMDLTEMAVLLVNKGFPNDAMRVLSEALKMDKRNHEAAFRMGLVLQRQGKHAKACRYYRRTLKERPGHGPARFMLALAQERSGRTRAAIRNYALAYRYATDLADPAKNPLVLDSNLQVQAFLEHHRDTVGRASYHMWPVDFWAVQRMMLVRPGFVAPDPPAAAPAAAPAPGPAAAAAPAAPVAPRRAPGVPVSRNGPSAAPTDRPPTEPAAAKPGEPPRSPQGAPAVVLPVGNVSAAP